MNSPLSKNLTRLSAHLVLLLLALTLTCCSSVQKKDIETLKSEVSQELKDQAIDLATQAIIDLLGKYQAQVKGLEYLNKIGAGPIGPILSAFSKIDDQAKKSEIPIESNPTLTPSQITEALAIIEDAEKNWTNKNGWMRLSPKDSENGYDNENPWLFSAEYLWLIKRLGLLVGPLKEAFRTRFRQQILTQQLQPGLYDRYPVTIRPSDVRAFSLDEQLGLIVMDAIFDSDLGYTSYANDQYNYGNKYDFLYMNAAWSSLNKFNRPIIRSDIQITKAQEIPHAQRFGAFIEVIRRATKQPSIGASDIVLCAGYLLSSQTDCGGVSDHMMNFMSASVLKSQTASLDGCIYKYKEILSKKFQVGNTCGGKPVVSENMFGAFTDIYFQQEQHPIRKLAKFLPAGGL